MKKKSKKKKFVYVLLLNTYLTPNFYQDGIESFKACRAANREAEPGEKWTRERYEIK